MHIRSYERENKERKNHQSIIGNTPTIICRHTPHGSTEKAVGHFQLPYGSSCHHLYGVDYLESVHADDMRIITFWIKNYLRYENIKIPLRLVLIIKKSIRKHQIYLQGQLIVFVFSKGKLVFLLFITMETPKIILLAILICFLSK